MGRRPGDAAGRAQQLRGWVGAAAVAEPDEVVRAELVKLLERATLDLEQ
ncbi:hypothetical protein [Nocardia sp. NPDC046763]